MLSGFANADVKAEGAGVSYDDAQETYTARYTVETIALAFAITDQPNIPNTCLLYTSPSPRDRTRSRMPSSA